MATAKVKKIPVYSWAFNSSVARGGQIISYIANLNEDESITCNCPGWIFAKKGQARECKHTKQIAKEAKEVWKKYKKGEPLPLLDLSTTGAGANPDTKNPNVPTPSGKIRYGRVLDLE
jgi:hypothetical protein